MSVPPPHLRVIDPDASRPDLEAPGENGEQPEPKAPGFHSLWTADALMAAVFPEPKWAVPGILAEGVSLLAGPPKVGKSSLSLGLGLQAASSGTALGSIPVTAGPVLYLALEDTPTPPAPHGQAARRQARPASLHLETACPPLPQGGELAIAGWLTEHPDAPHRCDRRVRQGPRPSCARRFRLRRRLRHRGRANRLADHFGVALVLVHHVSKAAPDDFLAEVSGTNGLAGAADTTIVLKRSRGKADGVLHLTGRDVDEAEHAMSFQPETGAWHLLDGPVGDHTIGDTRATILRYVRDHPGSKPLDISNATRLDRENTRRTCLADGRRRPAHRQPRRLHRAHGTARPSLSGPTLSCCPSPRPDQPECVGTALGQPHSPLLQTWGKSAMTTALEALTVPEVMAALRLSRNKVHDLIRSRQLASFTEGRSRRIPADSLADYLRRKIEESY